MFMFYVHLCYHFCCFWNYEILRKWKTVRKLMKYDIDSRRSLVHVAYMRVGWEITNVRFPGPAWTRIYGNSMMYFWSDFQPSFLFFGYYWCLQFGEKYHLLLKNLLPQVTISSAECKKGVSDIFGKIEFLMEYENIGL